jgi:putative ABC transport system permease protein
MRHPRHERTVQLFDQLQQDLRHALRGLRRSPGFAATVIVTLGLGIGANAAMFNVVDRLMFRPLAYLRDPGAVHRIYWQWEEPSRTATIVSTQFARYLDLQRWTTSFAQTAAFYETNLAVGEGAAARERRVGAVSATFFEFFDARPPLGRFFVATEDVTPRGAEVAVLSYGFWQSEYGGRDVQGEQLQVGSVRATIIGVAPQGFAGVNDANPPAVFVPITTFAGSAGTTDARTYFTRYHWGFVNIVVRRRPGVTVQQAAADATQAFVRSWEPGRADNPSLPSLAAARPRVLVSSVRPGNGPVRALESRTALWVAGVAAIVLIIACANVANLFLARSLGRHRETAVRVALGISRYRLMQQSLTESLMLAVLGGTTAVLVAQWAGVAITRMLISSPAAPADVLTDARTLWVTAGLAVVTGIVLGLVPSTLLARRDVARSIRGGVGGGVAEGARLRGTLLIVQATLSVVLLIGAVLFVRSVEAVQGMRMGYDAERVLLVYRGVRGPFPTESEHRATRALLLSTGRSIPRVESAAWLSSAPFVSTSSTNLYVEGIDAVDRLGIFTFQATTPDYFQTMGTRIIRGRGLTADDRPGFPNVAVVSASMALRLWPQQEAIGKCFRMRSESAPCTTVVGVAEDMVQRDIVADRYHYYVSIDQYTRSFGNWMAVRMRGDAAREAENVRQALQRAMPGNTYVTVHPLQTIVEDAQRSWRMGATLLVAFGVLALVVAVVGLYGVVAYNVTQRRHELGVRVAVGAQRGDLWRLVMAQSVTFAGVAIVLGILVTLSASRWIQPLLFQQSATDPVVYGGVAAVMIVVALAASLVPAVRASRVDPTNALRSD